MAVTFNPFTGTLDFTGSGSVTPAALTRVNDTNVTLALGGTPATALLQATSLTLGWSGQLAVARGGTALSGVAAGSILAANALDTLSAITSTSGLKVLKNNAGTVSWNTVTGTGDSVMATQPTFITDLTSPIVYGSAAVSGNLLLQSTSSATRGTVQIANKLLAYTANDTAAATVSAMDCFTGAASISTGTLIAVNMSPTITMIGNGAAGGILALFNAQCTVKDDGTSRSIAESLYFACQPTYTATVASGLVIADLAGLAGVTGFAYLPTLSRTGAGTGTATTLTGFQSSSLSAIGTGWTVTNFQCFLAEKPGTLTGTLSNFFGFKNTGAAATAHWAFFESGGMQSAFKGKVRFGDNTAPGALIEIAAGTATANTSPLKFTSGTNLTAAEAGACEYDGAQYYQTIDTSSGRGAVPIEQYVHLVSAGGAVTTIANFFGANTNISLVASAYYLIEVFCYFLKDTNASVVTWTFTNSAAPTGQNIESEFSPIAGIVTGTPTATTLFGHIYNDTTAAKTIATGTLAASVNHFCRFRIMLKNGTGTSLKIQATVTTGNITPGIGSYWRARRLSPNNIGTLAA